MNRLSTYRPRVTRPLARIWSGRATLPRDLFLLTGVVRLTFAAQQISKSTPLDEIVRRMLKMRHLPKSIEPQLGLRATKYVGHKMAAWFGWLDSCLVRSLVLGALLADHQNVSLHFGFRSADDEAGSLQGHSWIGVNGEILHPTIVEDADSNYFEDVIEIPLER